MFFSFSVIFESVAWALQSQRACEGRGLLRSHGATHDEQLDKGLAERLNDMVDLQVQLVGSEERAPAGEDGVCHLKNANVGLGVGRREPANEFLGAYGKHEVVRSAALRTYLCQSVPSPPEVRVSYDTDGFTELCLDIGGGGDHEANQALFDGGNLILGELVVALLVLRIVRSAPLVLRHT